MKEIESRAEFEELVIGNSGRVVVDFFATWCGPCKMLAPIFERVAEEKTSVTFCKLDVDKCEDVARELGIMSIPTLVLFEGGEEIKRNVGSLGRAALDEFIG